MIELGKTVFLFAATIAFGVGASHYIGWHVASFIVGGVMLGFAVAAQQKEHEEARAKAFRALLGKVS